jgi:hypothetical protein
MHPHLASLRRPYGLPIRYLTRFRASPTGMLPIMGKIVFRRAILVPAVAQQENFPARSATSVFPGTGLLKTIVPSLD